MPTGFSAKRDARTNIKAVMLDGGEDEETAKEIAARSSTTQTATEASVAAGAGRR